MVGNKMQDVERVRPLRSVDTDWTDCTQPSPKFIEVMIAEGDDWEGYRKLATRMIEFHIAEAEAAIVLDPYSFDPSSRFLLNHDSDCAERNSSDLPLWCGILGIEVDVFTDWMAGRLDDLADTIKKSPNVAAISSLTVKQDEDVRPTFIHLELFMGLPVHRAPDRDRVRTRRRVDPTGTHQLSMLAAA